MLLGTDLFINNVGHRGLKKIEYLGRSLNDQIIQKMNSTNYLYPLAFTCKLYIVKVKHKYCNFRHETLKN